MKSMLKKIFFKLLGERKKDYIRVILSGIFCISVVFFSTSVGSSLVYISTGRRATMTELVMEVEKNFILPYVLLIFLMILIIFGYIRKRSGDYAMLNILGIKKKHRYMYIGCEYLGIILGSIAGGVILGILEAMIVKKILENIFQNYVSNIYLGISPLILTLIISVIMFGIGFAFCDQYIACIGIDHIVSGGSNHNRASKNTLLFCLIGVAVFILTLVSIVTYWGQIGYTIPTALGIITAVIFTLFGCRLYLEKLRKQKNKYYKKILWLDNWYDQFFSHANISYIVSAFLIVILFGFNIVLVDNLPVRQPENYPYDIVWGANTKDKAFIEKLKEKYNVQTEFIPSIRVTSGNCAEHTGISATEYKRLTGKQVHLKNDEIYVIYQWDRSEYGTIGLDFGKLKPRLYTGCATADIWIYTARTLPGNKFTRKYTIKGNDRRIITGNFKTRVLSTSNMNTDVFEDIIVFSDHEYDKISQKAKGSNLTVVMNVPQNYDVVVNKITNYAAKHSQINFFDYHDGNLIYDKKQCTIENQENRMLNVSAMLIDMLVLFISIIFILLEKISSDYEALEWKYLFYYRTGMPEKKRRKNIYKEITMTSKVALITGMFIAAVMILVKILYKKMPVYWTKIYLAEAAVMIIGMTAIIMIIVRIAAWRSFKHSERRNRDE